MELEIQEKRENPLLDRIEVKFVIHHPNQPTPKRENVREQLSQELKVPKDTVIVDNMSSTFGVQDTHGYAKIYSKKEVALEVERKHHLIRNRLVEDDKKKKKPAAEEKAAPKEEAEEEPSAKEKGDDKAEGKKKGEEEPKKEKKKDEAKPEKKDKKADKSEEKLAKED